MEKEVEYSDELLLKSQLTDANWRRREKFAGYSLLVIGAIITAMLSTVGVVAVVVSSCVTLTLSAVLLLGATRRRSFDVQVRLFTDRIKVHHGGSKSMVWLSTVTRLVDYQITRGLAVYTSNSTVLEVPFTDDHVELVDRMVAITGVKCEIFSPDG